jgi:hypothetical protein
VLARRSGLRDQLIDQRSGLGPLRHRSGRRRGSLGGTPRRA